MPADPNLHPDLDALLDAALSTYAEAEPDPSLRARIVARAAQTTSAWPFRRPVFAAIASAAALALAFVLLHSQHGIPAPKAADTASTTAPVVSAPSPAAPQTPPAVERTRAVRTARHARHVENASLERSRYKASDDALTEEDRILLQFATEHPKEARQVLASPPPQPVEVKPIVIPPIEVAALSQADQSAGSNQNFQK